MVETREDAVERVAGDLKSAMVDGTATPDWSKADAFKEKGNGLFKAGKFEEALRMYSAAIEESEPSDMESVISTDDEASSATTPKNPAMPVYLSNRSFCHIRMENYGCAILDSTKALDIDPNFFKARYRRGCAYMAMGKFKPAQKDLMESARRNPQDRDVREKLAECKRQVAAAAFAKAIEQEKTKKPSEVLDVTKMVVDQKYTGPVFNPDATPEERIKFATDVLEWQKDPDRKLARKYAYQLVLAVGEIFKALPSCVDVEVPAGGEFTICGDIHGQYYDFLHILEKNGLPSTENPYLFNGDFVDRGSFSVECILALFAWKWALPEHFHMSRGNHESKNLNMLYGFEGEVKAKYESELYDLFCEVFCALPLCHVINRSIFVVHGGLFSKDNVTLDDLRKVERFREPAEEGLLPELLWSDPQPMPGRAPSKRGVAISFGPNVTNNFLETNGLDFIVRSHEMKMQGYELDHDDKLCTIFSAPNYCDQMGNKGAYIRVQNKEGAADPKKALGESERSIGKSLRIGFNPFASSPHPPAPAMRYANPALFGGLFGGGGPPGGGN